jgi:hypothetical protein
MPYGSAIGHLQSETYFSSKILICVTNFVVYQNTYGVAIGYNNPRLQRDNIFSTIPMALP